MEKSYVLYAALAKFAVQIILDWVLASNSKSEEKKRIIKKSSIILKVIYFILVIIYIFL
mgnify:FL=1